MNTITVTAAKIAVTTSATGPSQIRSTYDDVSITATAKFAVSCVDGTAPITIRIGRIDLSDALAVSVNGLTTEGDTTLPPSVDQMLALRDGGAANILAQTAQLLVQPIVVSEAGPELQLAATEVWLPGHVAGDDEDLDNVFVLARNETVKIGEQRLNSTRAALINSIDFAASNATDEVVTAAREALDGEGIILAGPRVIRNGRVARSAERFWLRAPE